MSRRSSMNTSIFLLPPVLLCVVAFPAHTRINASPCTRSAPLVPLSSCGLSIPSAFVCILHVIDAHVGSRVRAGTSDPKREGELLQGDESTTTSRPSRGTSGCEQRLEQEAHPHENSVGNSEAKSLVAMDGGAARIVGISELDEVSLAGLAFSHRRAGESLLLLANELDAALATRMRRC